MSQYSATRLYTRDGSRREFRKMWSFSEDMLMLCLDDAIVEGAIRMPATANGDVGVDGVAGVAGVVGVAGGFAVLVMTAVLALMLVLPSGTAIADVLAAIDM
ncbi:hypothetical protein LPJ66_008754 [Kickxella alabastrina]|uniref:Uncharacterized protein n=1 Tax=Kickxella alabastrina TaxID=61397 RepID=A0ACC1IBD3_9FUNG|nr:hypothetical protein LPJ66_008754 [Kickxella alabastrina]